MGVAGFSHIGICVRDLEISTRFYEEVLGFHRIYSLDFADGEVSATMERPGPFSSRMLGRGDLRIELLWWHDTDPDVPAPGRPPMDSVGFTHLSFRVDGVHDLVEVAERCGGAAWPSTLTAMGEGEGAVAFLYLTDPDGNRIECMAGTPELPI
jgi:lactoylglutathione lyase